MTDTTHNHDDLDLAFEDTRPIPPPPRRQRSEFQEARKLAVDLLVAGSDGAIDHRHFNGLEIADLQAAATEAGIRPWQDTIGENKRLRQALAAELAGRHRHVAADDLQDVLDPGQPFNLEQVLTRASEVETQRSEGARNLLTTALAELGVDVQADGFSIEETLRRAAAPPAPQPEIDRYTAAAAYRTANLPNGRPTTNLPGGRDQPPAGVHGSDLVEWQAKKDFQSGKFK